MCERLKQFVKEEGDCRRADPLPLGGVGAQEDFWHAYEEAGRYPVDPRQVRFWEIVGNLRLGPSRSVEEFT